MFSNKIWKMLSNKKQMKRYKIIQFYLEEWGTITTFEETKKGNK
jgi:hypothetical protein